jgi:GrpB-like predicted nucleotidyltransferase (UPF0157 family)
MPDPPETSNPLTEEQIENTTVGGPERLEGKVLLVESNPAWPGLFAREEARVESILGSRVLRLEHVGSTSVPGLPAKSIIDMVMAVADSSDEISYVPDLEAAGYRLRLREPEWFEHRLFKGPDTDINLHVFTVGEPEIDRMITFRDHLRANRQDRRLYAEVKADLAARDWRHVQEYADAKSPVVAEIMGRAMAFKDPDPGTR